MIPSMEVSRGLRRAGLRVILLCSVESTPPVDHERALGPATLTVNQQYGAHSKGLMPHYPNRREPREQDVCAKPVSNLCGGRRIRRRPGRKRLQTRLKIVAEAAEKSSHCDKAPCKSVA